MKVLVIGSGGREHAICQKLKKSKRVSELLAAPGNAGMAEIAGCVPIGAMEFDKIVDYSVKNKMDLVFVAPDDPLSGGLVDELERAGVRTFGPRKNAAIVEGSKAFSKQFMKRHSIPTAESEIFEGYEEAAAYLKTAKHPIVIKADGLAAGKGVLICKDLSESLEGLKSIMLDRVFGASGSKVVIEEFMTGKEATVLAFTDGKTVKCMPAAQDHKRAYDGDKGLNTGGMGAFAPTPAYTKEIEEETLERIIYPTIEGLREEGREFKGVIYFGLMLTEEGVKVVEYNARFGDPETQVILPLLKTDFMDIIDACIDGHLDNMNVEWEDSTALCVAVVSGGYPESVEKGNEIKIGNLNEELELIHSGTAFKDGKLVTNAGRVFCLTAKGKDIAEAREKVYAGIDNIVFEGARYRKDIGIK